MTKTQQKKQSSKKGAKPKARQSQGPTRAKTAPRLQNVQDAHLNNYLGFLNHAHNEPRHLSSPSLHSRRVATWHSWGRILVTSGVAATNALHMVLNPMRWCENTVFRGSTVGAALPACTIGDLNMGNQPIPASYGATLAPSEGNYPTTGASAGNRFGYRRWVGATLQVRYLGTELNRGGEIILVSDSTAGGVVGSTPTQIMAHPRARRFPIKSGGEATTVNFWPTGDAIDFINCPQWNTDGCAADDLVQIGDVRTYGTGNLILGAGGYGKNDVPLGWNTAMVIRSAADTQIYEVTLCIRYEGELATVSLTGNIAERLQALPLSQTKAADPVGAGFVSTLVHSLDLSGPHTNKPTSSFGTKVEQALQAVSPLANRLIDKGFNSLAKSFTSLLA